ncbi:hypothetical protein MMC25_005282 [Agyrium rufum]|nr:hypothetical protein [Agyrium rufum]
MDKNLSSLLKWSVEHSTPSTTSNRATLPTHSPPSPSSSNAITTNDDPTTDPTTSSTATPRTQLNPELLAALMGGPSDADLMKSSIAAVLDDRTPHEEKLVAFDNFEQLVEQIDNAMNIQALGLWGPLGRLLGWGMDGEGEGEGEKKEEREGNGVNQVHGGEGAVNGTDEVGKGTEEENADLRRMAAWCVGTAVQNNEKAQERALAVGIIPKLVRLALHDTDEKVRRKAVYALSSEVRNYQPGVDELIRVLPVEMNGGVGKGDGDGEGDGDKDGKSVDAADMEAVDRIMERLRGVTVGGGGKGEGVVVNGS